MDNSNEISLSRIATILNKNKMVRTDSNSKWERILSNAGQSDLYHQFSDALNPYWYNGNFKNENFGFQEFYSAIKNILQTVYNNGTNYEEFVVLMGEIVKEINVLNLFHDKMNSLSNSKFMRYSDEIEEFFEQNSDNDCMKYIVENADDDFQEMRNNLNVLNLDISYSKGQLKLMPFTEQSSITSRNSSSLMEWLNREYPSVGELYEEAIDNYMDGEAISCISNCRNIITGIFSHFKNDGNMSWTKGLQNLSTDTNIDKVNAPKNIPQGSANKDIDFETDKVFKYPRFNLIYKLYSLSSDLGAHSTEAPKIDGVLHPEKTTLNDALLCLRMTEDVLIWTKERLKSYTANSVSN